MTLDLNIEFRLERLDLKSKSSKPWLNTVLDNFDTFLKDHAACERKASATCLSFVAKYRDRPALVAQMIELALEELEHFQQVCQRLYARGLMLAEDEKDPYVNALLLLTKGNSEDRFCDRLLISGIIEARGCERFAMISDSLKDEDLKAFYWKLSRAEAKHQLFFVHLAELYFSKEKVEVRLEELLMEEAQILENLPLRAALH